MCVVLVCSSVSMDGTFLQHYTAWCQDVYSRRDFHDSGGMMLSTGLFGCGVGVWLGMSQCDAVRQCGVRLMMS